MFAMIGGFKVLFFKGNNEHFHFREMIRIFVFSHNLVCYSYSLNKYVIPYTRLAKAREKKWRLYEKTATLRHRCGRRVFLECNQSFWFASNSSGIAQIPEQMIMIIEKVFVYSMEGVWYCNLWSIAYHLAMNRIGELPRYRKGFKSTTLSLLNSEPPSIHSSVNIFVLFCSVYRSMKIGMEK